MDLMDHQQEAVEFSQGKRSFFLADAPGLGKTRTAIYRDLAIEAEGQTLIICPNTVKQHWLRELKICGVDNALVFESSNKKEFFDKVSNSQFIIINYDMVKILDSKIKFKHIILDEAHRIKNRKTQIFKFVKALQADYKTAMTGTPVKQHPQDAWAILHWLRPGQYTSYWKFFKRYIIVKTNFAGYDEIIGVKYEEEFRDSMKDFFLQRTKEELLNIPKTYEQWDIELTPYQRKQYKEMQKEFMTWLDDQDDKSPLFAQSAASKMSRLGQIALAPVVFDTEGKVSMSLPSAKISAIVEYAKDYDNKFVVFTSSKIFAKLLEQAAKDNGIDAEAIHGDVKVGIRQTIIDKFQGGSVQMLVATYQAASEGITLTAANTMIFADKSWEISANSQAEDRIARIGQQKTCHYINIVATNTIDEYKGDRVAFKKQIIDQLIKNS